MGLEAVYRKHSLVSLRAPLQAVNWGGHRVGASSRRRCPVRRLNGTVLRITAVIKIGDTLPHILGQTWRES